MNLRQRLDEIRQLEQKATPGPWEVGMRNGHNARTVYARDAESRPEWTHAKDTPDDYVQHFDTAICDVHGMYMNTRVDEHPESPFKTNAALIAAMRNAIGPLLEVVEAQHRALEGLSRECSIFVVHGEWPEMRDDIKQPLDAALIALSLMDKEES